MSLSLSLRIWVCEDSEDQWAPQREVLLDEFPGCRVQHFENAGYAARATGSPDFIIIDVGGMSGFGTNVAALTRANVQGLAELHPGAVFIIFSAIGVWAEDAWEELEPEVRACSTWVDGCDFYSSIGDAIRTWL